MGKGYRTHAEMEQGEPVVLKDGSTVFYDRGGYQRSRQWVGWAKPLAFSHRSWGSVLPDIPDEEEDVD